MESPETAFLDAIVGDGELDVDPIDVDPVIVERRVLSPSLPDESLAFLGFGDDSPRKTAYLLAAVPRWEVEHGIKHPWYRVTASLPRPPYCYDRI